jgi:hypothetical protein
MLVLPFGLSLPIGLIIALLLFASALLGMLVSSFLPKDHLSPETKNVVSVSTAIFGTLAALVVGLLISTASTSFTSKAQDLSKLSSDLIRLDRLLQRYGPEAQTIRVLLHRYTEAKLRDLFPGDAKKQANVADQITVSSLEEVESEIVALKPASDAQRWLQPHALQIASAVEDARWQLAQEDPTRIPTPVLTVVLFWFALIFASFGLFAPRNWTAFVAIFLCAAGVGSAIWMTSELHQPFQGLIRVSSAPLTDALEAMSR